MDNFAFTPTEGFRNGTSFPDPSTETEAREQLQRLHDQTRDFINGVVGAVNQNASDIAQNASDIDSLELVTAQHTSGIAQNALDIDNLEAQHTGDVNTINQKINAIPRAYFGTCATDSSTRTKVISLNPSTTETLRTGDMLVISPSYDSGSYSTLTLSISPWGTIVTNQGASWRAYDSYLFIYTGSVFVEVGLIPSSWVDNALKGTLRVGSTSFTEAMLNQVIADTAQHTSDIGNLRTLAENTAEKAETLEDECSLIRGDLDAKADATALWETNRNVTTNELNIGRIYDDLHDIFPEHTKNGSGASFTGANYIRLGGQDIYGSQIATKDYVDDAVDIPVASARENGLMPSEFYQTVNSIKFHYQMIITAGNTSNQIFFVFPNTRMETFNIAVSAYEYDSSANRFTKKDVGWTLEYNGQVTAGYAYRFEATIDSASSNPIYVNIYSNATGYTR